ncbi:MAG: hypothetical protein FJZ75_03680 [Bacteroidetes bacterium]|nr:hypothetical protein [Bacteroidota bacterium]
MRKIALFFVLALGISFSSNAQTYRVPIGFFTGSNLAIGPAFINGSTFAWFQWNADISYTISPKISGGIEAGLVTINFGGAAFSFVAKGGYHIPLSKGQLITNAGIGGLFGGGGGGLLLQPDVRYRYELTPFLFAEGGVRMPIVLGSATSVALVPHVGLMYSF